LGEDDEDEGFKPVVRGWPALACLAWEGYQSHGPGVVYMVEKQASPWVGEVHYTPVEAIDDAPDDEFKESIMLALLAYEPMEQIVLVLVDADQVARVMTLSGEVTPPQAYAERVVH
jgi:hypothetical protein